MRTALFCAALAAALVPADVGAQSLNLTEADALARLSPESPRARAARAGVDVARADVLSAGRWPNPRMTFDREVSGWRHREHLHGRAAAAHHRPPRFRGAGGLRHWSAPRPVAPTKRFVGCAQTCDWRLPTWWRRRLASEQLTTARDRLRELADVLAKREAAGDAAGFDRLRAEREVLDIDTDRALAATDRARAQAIIASFFVDVSDPTQIVAVAAPAAPAVVPALDALLEQAESTSR